MQTGNVSGEYEETSDLAISLTSYNRFNSTSGQFSGPSAAFKVGATAYFQLSIGNYGPRISSRIVTVTATTTNGANYVLFENGVAQMPSFSTFLLSSFPNYNSHQFQFLYSGAWFGVLNQSSIANSTITVVVAVTYPDME